MAGRRGGRGLSPERALEISLDGTSRRLVDDGIPTADAVEQLRTIAGDRTDMLAKVAGGMIGGYLGHPLTNPLVLPAAYLLILAGADHDHAALVASADAQRHNASTSAYSNG